MIEFIIIGLVLGVAIGYILWYIKNLISKIP